MPSARSRSARFACSRASSGVATAMHLSFGAKPLDPFEIDLGQAKRGERSAPDPARKMGDGREGDVVVLRRQGRGGAVARPERPRIDRFPAGKPRIEASGGRQTLWQACRAPLDRELDLAGDVVHHLQAFGTRIIDAEKPLRLRDGRDADRSLLVHGLLRMVSPAPSANLEWRGARSRCNPKMRASTIRETRMSSRLRSSPRGRG